MDYCEAIMLVIVMTNFKKYSLICIKLDPSIRIHKQISTSFTRNIQILVTQFKIITLSVNQAD